MSIAFASLGSGSSGNATLVRVDSSLFLIDTGFSARELTRRMNGLGVYPEQLTAIFISHEHIDHTRGLAVLARKFNTPVWLTSGTFGALKDSGFGNFELLHPHGGYRIADARLNVFPIPHDAAEPCQFILSDGQRRVAIATDMGCATPYVVQQLHQLDGLLIEANYDEHMLRSGSYPQHLQNRIAGRYGHLSNVQTLRLLEQLETGAMQHLLLGHLSENNNTPDCVQTSMGGWQQRDQTQVGVLQRHCASEWFELD